MRPPSQMAQVNANLFGGHWIPVQGPTLNLVTVTGTTSHFGCFFLISCKFILSILLSTEFRASCTSPLSFAFRMKPYLPSPGLQTYLLLRQCCGTGENLTVRFTGPWQRNQRKLEFGERRWGNEKEQQGGVSLTLDKYLLISLERAGAQFR